MAHAQLTTPRWALVLGASSGFGEATARALAKAGYDIAGVHLDRKAGLKHVEDIVADLTAGGRRARFFNVNAADDAKRQEVLDALETDIQAQGGTVAVLMHSLAFGTLKPYIADDALTRANIEMTLDVMANSLVYWAQDLIKRRLMGQGGRIFSMTSSGSTRVIASYGAVTKLDPQGPPRRLPPPPEAARRDEAAGRGGGRTGTLAKGQPGEYGRGLPDGVRASGPAV